MTNFSNNLSTHAYQLGYRLEGDRGTYGSLQLTKDGSTVKDWDWSKIPNIIEMEEIVDSIESQKSI